MDIFEKNLLNLQRYNPSLEKLVREKPLSDLFEVGLSRNKFPIIKKNGLSIHSVYDPIGEAQKMVGVFLPEKADTILITGFGMGYHVEELLTFQKKLVVIEPSFDLFKKVLHLRNFSEIISQVEFRVGEDPRMLGVEMKGEGRAIFRHMGSERVNKEYFTLFFHAFNFEVPKTPLKISVVGPIHGGSLTTAKYVSSSLKDMGHMVDFIDCSTFSDSFFKIDNVLRDKVNEGVVRNKYLDFLGEMIIARASDFSPEIIIVLAQAPLSPRVIVRLKKSEIPIAFWFVEDFRTLDYWKYVAPHYDYFFTIQRGEFFNQLSNLGVKNKFYLSQACYPKIHKKIELSIDDKKRYGSLLSFVGAGYYNRQIFFKGLKKFDFKIWGTEWNKNSPLSNLLKGEGKRLSPAEYIKIFNGTNINLNLHSSTYHEGVDPTGDFVNPRTFELASCGSFQLVDNRSNLHEMFDIGTEIICFENIEDLRDKIDYYKGDPDKREEISRLSQKKALKCHTFEKRLNILLGIILLTHGEKILERQNQKIQQRMDSINNIGRIMNDAGVRSDLAKFLDQFPENEIMSLKKVMDKIEKGSGNITKNEAILMMMNQILTGSE